MQAPNFCFPLLPCHVGMLKFIDSLDLMLDGRRWSSRIGFAGSCPAKHCAVKEPQQRSRRSAKEPGDQRYRRIRQSKTLPEPAFEVSQPLPISANAVAQQELALLQAQSKQLRTTIARRRRVTGASSRGDDVSSIVAHYEAVLAELQIRIAEITLSISSDSQDVDTAAASSAEISSVPSMAEADLGVGSAAKAA